MTDEDANFVLPRTLSGLLLCAFNEDEPPSFPIGRHGFGASDFEQWPSDIQESVQHQVRGWVEKGEVPADLDWRSRGRLTTYAGIKEITGAKEVWFRYEIWLEPTPQKILA